MISHSRNEELAWLAGIVEADGCIMFKDANRHHGGRLPRIRVTMADEDIVRDLHRIAGVGCFRGPLPKSYSYNQKNLVKPPEHPKPLYLWEVNAKSEVDHVLREIRPYLHMRRGLAADEALTFLEEHYPNGNYPKRSLK
jgi:hypothetical protein